MSEALAVGLMSGTSLDGVDAALVRIRGPEDVDLVSFATEPYTETERSAILKTIEHGGPREVALLHVALGERFAAAVLSLCARHDVRTRDLALVASHGQTIWHEPGRATLQVGDPAVIAERTGARVVSDFRSRDVAAGGQGAPLASLADVVLFGRANGPRVLLNIGGMANLTYVPRQGETGGALAFDTGPGVGVIDAVVHALDPDQRFDRDGARASRGRVREEVLEMLLADEYFRAPPPKSTGREQFGPAYAARLLRLVRDAGGSADDAVATATALTVRSIARGLDRFTPKETWDLVVSGGGARNAAIMAGLSTLVPETRRFDELFFDGDAKEAVVFAFIGWLTLQGEPGNLPAATGAAGGRILGSVVVP